MCGGIVGLFTEGAKLKNCINYGFSSGKGIFGTKTSSAGDAIDCKSEYKE